MAGSWVPDLRRRRLARAGGLGDVRHHLRPATRTCTHLYLPGDFEGHPLRKDFPLLSRRVKPWPGIVDVEPMPGEEAGEAEDEAAEAGDEE